MTEDLRASAAVPPTPSLIEAANTDDGQKPSPTNNEEKKKRGKGGRFNIFKAALFMMRKSNINNQKKKQIQSPQKEDHQLMPSKGENWRKLVGSIRPLHIPDNQTTPTLSPSTTVDNFEDLLPHASSCSFPSPSAYEGSSTAGTMSQYASACNLQELDADNNSDDENEDDPDEVFDAIRGDEMIDAKAEQFIAQFYQQMRLQNI